MKLLIRYKIEIYYFIMSLLFSFQSLSLIDNDGDQRWFSEMASEMNYDYLQFAIDRYYNWSSRLLIESTTMFFSVHQYFFSIILIVVTFFLLLVFKKLLIRRDNEISTILLPIIFLLIFPSYLFTSAGLIATVTNYYLPMFTLTISWYFYEKNDVKYIILATPFLVYTVMQEQFAVFTFLIFFYLFISFYLDFRKINFGYLVVQFFSIIGILSAAISPGSKVRSNIEIETWYPNFEQITLFNKVFLGFIDTNRVLFLGEMLVFLYIIILLTFVVAMLKRNVYSLVASGSLLLLFIFNKLGLHTILSVFHEIITETPIFQFNIKSYFLIYFMTIMLLFIVAIVWSCFDSKKKSLFVLFLLISGYLSRMLVVFSPTIYASGERTFIPLIYSGFIVSILLIDKIVDLLNNNYKFSGQNKF